MAPKRTAKGRSKHAASSSKKRDAFGAPPGPFQTAPETLQPFLDELSTKQCYVAHIDSKPASFKRKIFSVPILMNVVVAALFVWRLWYIGPYYWKLIETALGSPNELTLKAEDMEWLDLAKTVGRRGITFMLDLCLAIFVWPWPYEFLVGNINGSPVRWRVAVGFRDKEVYVRRSRAWYHTTRHGGGPAVSKNRVDVLTDADARKIVLAHVAKATSPKLVDEKTGYLSMDEHWDLDWDLMVWATALTDDDKSQLTLDSFRTLVLLHSEEYGWVTVDSEALESFHRSSGDLVGSSSGLGAEEASPEDDARRKQVFAFRDALAAIGKEDLFFRWIEIIQYEASRPGGLGDMEHQAKVAMQVRELFHSNGIDFDAVWKEAVGTDGTEGLAGM